MNNETKNKGGRPEKYNLSFCLNEIQEFYIKLYEDEKIYTWQDLIRNKPYSLQRLSEWKKTFAFDEVFSETIKKIESELENRIIKLGISNKGNPSMVIFMLKNNYGWKDKVEQDINVESGLRTLVIKPAQPKDGE